MEREILFRGKRLDNGEWIIGHLLTYEDGRARIIPSHTDIFCYEKDDSIIQTVAYPVDPSTVGQYACMPDKNGKKIFEGDVVLKRTYNGKRAFPVTFTDGIFHAGYGGGSSTATHPYTLDDRQIEVIGNRWDNPELLEVKK